MWTQARLETVRTLWAEGRSAGEIARHLGNVSRNAVIGQVHRRGWQKRIDPHASGSKRVDRVRHKRAQRRPLPPKVRPARVETLPPDRAAIKALPMLGPHVTDLGPRCCHYIAGDPAIDASACGRATAVNRVYCAEHAKLCYEPAPKKRAKSERREPVNRKQDQSRWVWGAV